MTIWKYPVPLDTPGAVFHLKMPVGAEVLTVQLQQGKPTFWALLDPDARMIQRSFRIVGTGWADDDFRNCRYVGTWQKDTYVWHLFEEPR
jgi:hypothetical protein